MYFYKKTNRILYIVVTLVIMGLLWQSAKQIHQYFFAEPLADTTSVLFIVSEGESFKTIANRLQERGIIKSAWWFRLDAKLAGLDDDIKAGQTTLTPGDRYADILGALLYPAGESEISLTIPEGYTIAQIGEVVREKFPEITLEEWNRVTGASSPFTANDFTFLASKPAGVDLEGYLFPDTYRFFKDANAEDIVRKMLQTMQSRIEALGEPTSQGVLLNLHDRLTLASIVEREVRSAETMRNVADIFYKRLDIGMALQSDATINYVTNGDDPSVSAEDLQTDSLYNTYKYPGLPPGPISNPGMNALRAVWNPAENPYYYFLTDAEGNIYYAKTHDEHVVNKAKYLK